MAVRNLRARRPGEPRAVAVGRADHRAIRLLRGRIAVIRPVLILSLAPSRAPQLCLRLQVVERLRQPRVHVLQHLSADRLILRGDDRDRRAVRRHIRSSPGRGRLLRLGDPAFRQAAAERPLCLFVWVNLPRVQAVAQELCHIFGDLPGSLPG